jgi:hypothetical protein
VKTEILVVLAIAAAVALAVSFFRAPRHPQESTTTVFVFVKIPESIMPIERGEKYEDPLDVALKREKLGEVTGGGSQLGEPDAQGAATIDWVGLDVELTDLDRGLPFLKGELLRLNAPKQTTLEFQRAGRQVVEAITS